MSERSRPPLTPDLLATLTAYGGWALTSIELQDLHAPVSGLSAALERLDELDLQHVEPASVFVWPWD
jgi:hypothetical protein